MGLRMTSPTRRENSTVLQFKKRIPLDLVGALRGRRLVLSFPSTKEEDAKVVRATAGDVVKFSLGTRDPQVARMRAGLAAAQLHKIFEATRAGPAELSHKDIVALSGYVYRLFIDSLLTTQVGPMSGLLLKR